MTLPTVRAHRLAAQPLTRRWLIEALWADEAVGIVGGEPKCCKSFLALDIAVAGGVPCVRRFAPAQTDEDLSGDVAPLLAYGDQLALAVEHRAAASITAVLLQLAIDGDAVALAAIDRSVAAVSPAAAAAPATLADKVEAQLAGADAPLTAAALRKLCRVRNASLTAALTDLVVAGRAGKGAAGYVITHGALSRWARRRKLPT